VPVVHEFVAENSDELVSPAVEDISPARAAPGSPYTVEIAVAAPAAALLLLYGVGCKTGGSAKGMALYLGVINVSRIWLATAPLTQTRAC